MPQNRRCWGILGPWWRLVKDWTVLTIWTRGCPCSYANEWELRVEKSYCKELFTFTKLFLAMSTVANDNFINVADAIIFLSFISRF